MSRCRPGSTTICRCNYKPLRRYEHQRSCYRHRDYRPRLGDGHRVVVVACLELFDRIPSGRTYHQYINPERDVPKNVSKIIGLSTKSLLDCPKFESIAEELTTFLGDSPLVTHAFLVALVCTFVLAPALIAVAWLWYRPLVSIAVLAVGLGVAYGFHTLAARRTPARAIPAR
jgi:hypothetical protein